MGGADQDHPLLRGRKQSANERSRKKPRTAEEDEEKRKRKDDRRAQKRLDRENETEEQRAARKKAKKERKKEAKREEIPNLDSIDFGEFDDFHDDFDATLGAGNVDDVRQNRQDEHQLADFLAQEGFDDFAVADPDAGNKRKRVDADGDSA